MNIYNRGTVIAFIKQHADCKSQLVLWYNDVAEHNWKSAQDVKKSFARASIINRSRVVFDVGRNYRLIAEVNFQKGWLFIKFIGTHQEYNKVNAATIDLYSNKRRT